MYSIARTVSSSGPSVSSQTLRTICIHTNWCQGGVLRRTQSLVVLPFLSRLIFLKGASIRGISRFIIHPEKMKQMIKARDGQTLCHVFASEEYKNRIAAIAEEQKRILEEDIGIGLQANEVKYEHMLNCAQPISSEKKTTQKPEEIKEEEIITLLDNNNKKKRTKPIRMTILSLMLKKKRQEQELFGGKQESRSTIVPLVMKTKKKNIELRKKFRMRTTILPIFLKKMEQKTQTTPPNTVMHDYYNESSVARTKRNESESPTSHQAGVLSFVPYKDTNQYPDENEDCVDDTWYYRGNTMSARNLATATGRVPVVSYPYRSENTRKQSENEKDSSRRYAPHKATSADRDEEEDIAKKKHRNKHGIWTGITKKWKPAKERSKRQETSSCETNMPMVPLYELDAGLVDVIDTSKIIARIDNNRLRGTSVVGKPQVVEDILTLYDRVKLGSTNRPLRSIEEKKYSRKNISLVTPSKSKGPSLTYRIVSGDRERRENALMKEFFENVKYWKSNTSLTMNPPKRRKSESLTVLPKTSRDDISDNEN